MDPLSLGLSHFAQTLNWREELYQESYQLHLFLLSQLGFLLLIYYLFLLSQLGLLANDDCGISFLG